MAETLTLRQALKISGEVVVGDIEADYSITLTHGFVHAERGLTVADDYGVRTLWTSPGPIAEYKYGFIYSDQDVFVELRTAHGTPEYILLKIPAGVLAYIPMVAGGNDTAARLDEAVLVDGTDYDAVDRIQVGRDAAADEGDATISLFLFV